MNSSTFIRFLLGAGLVVMLIVATVDIEYYGRISVAFACSGLGALFGIALAMNDVTLSAWPDYLEIRNPLLVHRIPWAAIVDVTEEFGLTVKTGKRRIPASSMRATKMIVNRAQAENSRTTRTDILSRARAAQPSDAGPRTALKRSWLVMIPAGAFVFLLYSLGVYVLTIAL
jgi:Flp pilus assembly protein TadB